MKKSINTSLALGITGHRFLMDIDRLQAGIEEGFQRIRGAYLGRSVKLLSSLAEGADRLVAHQLLQHPDVHLVVPLPLDTEEYLTDFETPESKAEFRSLLGRAERTFTFPPAPKREDAYAQAGRYIADRCDILLALWDGELSQGKGGTAEVVEWVRSQQKPVVIVRTGNRKPGTREPTSLGPDQGRVIIERLP